MQRESLLRHKKQKVLLKVEIRCYTVIYIKKNDFRIALQGMLHQAICSMQIAMIIIH